MPDHKEPNWALPESLNKRFGHHILSLVSEEIVMSIKYVMSAL
jgi:hypothetical protein